MNKPPYIGLRVLLCLIALYHLVAGVAATFFQEAAVGIGSYLFGVRLTLEPQSELLVRYLGAFGIAFGVMAVLAALAPEQNRAFIYGAVAYFVVRAFDRIAFASLLDQFSVGPAPNWLRIVVIACFAVGLLVFLPRAKEAASGTPAQAPGT